MRVLQNHFAGASGVFLLLSMGTSSALRVAFVVLAGRSLGPIQYGEFYAAISLLLILGTGVTPVAGAVARFSSFYVASGDFGKLAALRRDMPRRVGWYSLGLAGIGAVLLAPLRPLLGFDSVVTLPFVLAALVLTLLLSCPRGFLRGTGDYRAFGLNLVIEAASRLAAAAAFLAWSVSTLSALLAYVFGSVVALAFAYAQMAPEQHVPEPSPPDLMPLEKMMGPLLAFAVITASYQNLDMLLVNRFFQTADAGAYAAASSIAKALGLLYLPFSVTLLPSFTTSLARRKSFLPTLFRSALAFLSMAALAVAILGAWGSDLVTRLYGQDFSSAARWTLPLAVAMSIGFVSAMIGQAFCAAQKYAFLVPYAGFLLVELLGLWYGRGDLDNYPWILVVVQGLNLLALIAYFLAKRPDLDNFSDSRARNESC